MEPNIYAQSAELYDLNPRVVNSADIPFFLRHAREAVEPVLEIACGTGRITIPIAEAGIRIHGLDLSAPMLERLHAKVAALSPTISERITVHQGNMISFATDQRFGLIFIPCSSFLALTSHSDQLSCLRCIRDHLTDEGRFIIDVFKPNGRLSKNWEGPPTVDWEVVDPRSGSKIVRQHVRKHIDEEKQILDVDYIFSIDDVIRFTDPLRLAFFYQDQIESLLSEAGFCIVESMGDYDGRPIAQGGELIYICEKS